MTRLYIVLSDLSWSLEKTKTKKRQTQFFSRKLKELKIHISVAVAIF